MITSKAFEYQAKTYLEGEQGKLPLVSPDWTKLEQQAIEKNDTRCTLLYLTTVGVKWTARFLQ